MGKKIGTKGTRDASTMLVKETMEETVWGNLPSELLERVLAFLPVDSLIRMRCVQRRWNELIVHSHSFAKHHANCSPRSLWFMLFARQMSTLQISSFTAYDINYNKWHQVPVPIPPSFPSQPLSTDGGLVCYKQCFVSHARQEPINLLVCNPLTGSSRQLPSLHATNIEVIGMVCDLEADGAAYRIFTVANVHTPGESCNYKVILYDAVTNQWTTEFSFQSDEAFQRSAIWFQGSFYFLSQSRTFYTLQVYNMQQRMWIKQATKQEQFFFHSHPFLMECQGRLFLVGDTLQICFQILELAEAEETGSRKWVKFDVMPRYLYLDYFDDMNVIVAGKGNFIFFQTQVRKEALMYDLSHKSWQWTSDCGVALQTSPHAGLMFQPRIRAVA